MSRGASQHLRQIHHQQQIAPTTTTASAGPWCMTAWSSMLPVMAEPSACPTFSRMKLRAQCMSHVLPHEAHRTARWVTRTSGSDTATARVDRGKAAEGCRLYTAPPLRRCSCTLPIAIQNLRNCTFPQAQKWVCGKTSRGRRDGL